MFMLFTTNKLKKFEKSGLLSTQKLILPQKRHLFSLLN
ncbi:hypothetical protein B4087_5837 [Bacillus cereus]|nr:hypothetical protein B4086_0187 [Bacillus cereus]KLA13583.1 hypothetical protein B4087_5837 [Bacillus cereus]